MGTLQLWHPVGSDIMIRILAAISCFVVLALCDADADAYYALHAPALVPALLNSYPNWPGLSTPFSSSTCYGCRGKRSAEPGYVPIHPFLPLPLVPAAAVSSDGANYAVHLGHPGFAGSYQSVTRARRSAEPGYVLQYHHPLPIIPAVSCCLWLWNQSSSSFWIIL